jgi:hypothetical protein
VRLLVNLRHLAHPRPSRARAVPALPFHPSPPTQLAVQVGITKGAEQDAADRKTLADLAHAIDAAKKAYANMAKSHGGACRDRPGIVVWSTGGEGEDGRRSAACPFLRAHDATAHPFISLITSYRCVPRIPLPRLPLCPVCRARGAPPGPHRLPR